MHCGQHAEGCCRVAGAEKLSFRLRLPLTRQLLRFGDLFWGHALRDRVSIFLASLFSCAADKSSHMYAWT